MTHAAAASHRGTRETHVRALELKRADQDGLFEGYASLFGQEDMGRDVILPGAFRESLARRGAAGVKLLFQHDPNQPIGLWLEIKEDARGLHARGRLMPEIEKSREVLALMRAGALDGLSIGFKTIKGRRDARTGVRRLEAIDLWEISVVTFPMLPDARVTAVKSHAAAQIHAAAQLVRGNTRGGSPHHLS